MLRQVFTGSGVQHLPAPVLDLNFLRGGLDSRFSGSGGVGGTRFDESGNLVSATAPRFDHSPITLARLGLLSERQRTNSIRNNSFAGAAAGDSTELVTNGTFTGTTGTGWTATQGGTGTVNFGVTGQATITGDGTNTSSINQAITTVVGRTYNLQITVGTNSCGVIVGIAQGGSGVFSASINAGGTYSVQFTATSTTTWIGFTHSAANATVVSGVSVQYAYTRPNLWVSVFNPCNVGLKFSTVSTESGIPYAGIRIFGTPMTTGTITVMLEQQTSMAAANGQFWVESVFVKLAAGSLTNVGAIVLSLRENDSGGIFLTSSNSATIVPTGAALASQRTFVQRTLNNASTAFVGGTVNIPLTAGQAVDFTLNIGAPQMEQVPDANSQPSTPILTTSAAVTRTEDMVSASGGTIAALMASVKQGVYTAEFESFAPAATGFNRVFEADDGTVNNAITLLANNGVGSQFYGNVTAGGVSQASLFTGSLTANTVRKVALSFALNDFALSDIGNTATTASAGTIPAVNTFVVGNIGGGGAALDGRIRSIQLRPVSPPKATTQMLARQ